MNPHIIQIARPRPIRPCKICSTPSPLYGTVDFNKNCEIQHGLILPNASLAVGYNKCPQCGFLFTSSFDGWGHKEYCRAIYNDDYIRVDPEYREARPLRNAKMVTDMFPTGRETLSLLDYGGGNGLLAETILKNGFQSAATYDPFNPVYDKLPNRRFNVVTCFETLEHVPDPRQQVAAIANCIDDTNGIIVFSTLVQPDDFEQLGLDWWYVGPRNGHISLFSRTALAEIWRQQGFYFKSFSDNLHIAFRQLPPFTQHLMQFIKK